MKPIFTYLKEVHFEISKVTWPKRDEVTKLTLLVVAVTAVVSIYVGALDYIFVKLLGKLLS